jgi:hypothetical protein
MAVVLRARGLPFWPLGWSAWPHARNIARHRRAGLAVAGRGAELAAAEEPRAGRHRLEMRAGPHRLETQAGLHRLETRAGRHRLEARAKAGLRTSEGAACRAAGAVRLPVEVGRVAPVGLASRAARAVRVAASKEERAMQAHAGAQAETVASTRRDLPRPSRPHRWAAVPR